MGDPTHLRSVAFVITRDTGTRLPRDASQKLIGTLAHHPVALRILEGCTILHPRPAIDLPYTRRTWFGRSYAGEVGTDPHTLAISDLCQDLFGEGSFVGEGIHDAVVFMLALRDALGTT